MTKTRNEIVFEILAEALEKIKEKTDLTFNAKIDGKELKVYSEAEDLNILDLSLNDLEEVVVDALNIKDKDILKKEDRGRDNADARKIFSYVAFEHKFTKSAIGQHLNKDHTTVIYHIKNSTDLLSTDQTFLGKYMKVCKKLKEKYAPIP